MSEHLEPWYANANLERCLGINDDQKKRIDVCIKV